MIAFRVHTPPHVDALGRSRAAYHWVENAGTPNETLVCAIVLTEGHVTSLHCSPRMDTRDMVEQAKQHFNQHNR